MPPALHATVRAGGETPPEDDRSGRPLGAGFGLLAVLVHDLPMGVLVVDRSLRALFANPSAQAILDQGDGISLVGGLLRERHGQVLESRLHRLLRGEADGVADAPEMRPFHLPRISGRRSYEVTLRLPSLREGVAASPATRHVIVYVRDPDAGVPVDERSLRERYHLTPAEARTALALTQGGTLPRHSELLKLRPMTIRGYIKQIFAKTDTHSQLDVLRLILTGAASMVIDRGHEPAEAPPRDPSLRA